MAITRILVTGATGNVGAHVVRELRRRGAAVRAFVRDPAAAAERLGDDVELAVGDFGDAASVRRALAGVDRVFLACANHPRQVEYETGVIDAAAGAGVARIVKLSTLAARVGSPVAFWDWQGRIEAHLRASATPAVLLHANFYMSNVLAAAGAVRSDGVLPAPAGGARVGMVDPRDVAAVAAAALTEDGHEGRTHVITGPEAITYAQIADALAAATGRAVRFVDVPDAAAREAFVAAGVPDGVAATVVALFGKLREGAGELVTDTVRAVTGRAPRTIAEFAHDHAPLFGTGVPGVGAVGAGR
jgi:uncharacterized protein YbjT (DUF2867 family)